MFAVLHIADFALHAVLRTEPEAALKPAALFANHHKKSLLLAANPAARACGIQLGMTAPQAVARCPTLLIRAPNADADAEARAALLAVAFTLSPAIEDTSPGICTADLKGSRTAPQPLAATAIAQLDALGLPATAGIGRTPLLALYAARAAADRHTVYLTRQPPQSGHPLAFPTIPQSELNLTPGLAEAPIPYRSGLPESHRVFAITGEKAFLAPLPLVAADPPPELAAILTTWGLRTLGDLTSLPRDEIVRRFGTVGLMLWNRASGGEPRPLHLVVPGQHFTATMPFEQEVETLEPLLFILRRLLDRLTLELCAAQLVAAEIELTLQLADDNRLNQLLMRTFLSKLKCEAVIANNGVEALELFQTQSFDVILMDHQMPVMDGCEASKAIRLWEQQQKRTRRIPIIAITANAMEFGEEFYRAAGMDAYLTKPLLLPQLERALATVRQSTQEDAKETIESDNSPDAAATAVRQPEPALELVR